MSLAPNYSFKPQRARAGMAYGQYNQIATYSTTDDGVSSGAVVSYADGSVTNGGTAPAGIVVDSRSLLGLGFDDQYNDSCCAVLEQGKAWALTKSGVTFSINDPVAYDDTTGELDPEGNVATGWTVVGGTVEDLDGTTRTLVQVIPLRQSTAPEAQQVSATKQETPAKDAAPVNATQSTSTKSDKGAQANKDA